MPVTIRTATDADLPALTRLDLTYPTDRYLAVERSGEPVEHTFSLRWRNRIPAPMAVYDSPTLPRLRDALRRTDLFLVALDAGEVVGYLIIVVPTWTDAAEITDLAVDVAARRKGSGTVLVREAAQWAQEHGYRSMWVEPRADNSGAISFYHRLGFRVSGFNDRMYSNTDHENGRPTLFMHLELS